MRLLLIRHGMTEGNLATARMAIRVAKGEVRAEDAHVLERDEARARGGGPRGADEGCGDTHLSDYKGGGVAEARALGDYWAPILQSKWDAGEMQVFVSPMLRCLQTADPLMRRLREGGTMAAAAAAAAAAPAAAPAATATVLPRIMELPGLCAAQDQVWLDEKVRPLFESGAEQADRAARRLLAARQWTRCGYTSDELQSMFPWAARFEGFPARASDGSAVPWWPGCFERPRETEHRIAEVREWLFDLARSLPKDDVVVMVSHGDTIWRVLASLMGVDATSEGSAVEHNTTNTSVSAIKIDPREGWRGDGDGISSNSSGSGNSLSCQAGGGGIRAHLSEFEVQLDFYNRTPHVVNLNDDHRNRDFYKFNKLMKRRMRPGQRQVDLSKGMRAERLRNREFMAKL
jgi:broad specificity phosphatase PhoE